MEGEWGTNHNVPEDLVIEILFYLPVKALMRCACVCKSWHRLIKSDHKFAMRNYLFRTTSSSNLLDSVGYMFNYSNKDQKPCLYAFTKNKTFTCPKMFECVSTLPPPRESLSMAVSNSCNGLVCFSLNSRSDMLLCNPSIREAVPLPPSLRTATARKPRIGLGFDPVNTDYKVVKIISPNHNTGYSWVVDVFSVRSGHWRNLPDITSPLHDICDLGPYNCALTATGRMCNWLAFKRQHNKAGKTFQILISFDMVEEVLKDSPMPECNNRHPKTYHDHRLLSSSRCQACLSCFQSGTNSIDIWVLNGGGTSIHGEDRYLWNKQYSVRFPEEKCLFPANFWINEKELLATKQRGKEAWEVFHYDVGSQQLKAIGWTGYIHLYDSSYAESILSVKGLMEDKQDMIVEQEGCVFSLREVEGSYVHCYCNFKLI